MKQRRFDNRTVLRPLVDLSDYSCRATIDWAELRVETTQGTQWKWILHHIERAIDQRCFTTRGEPGDDGKYREFIVRVQEPTLSMLTSAAEAVRDRWGLAQEVQIVGLEISIDIRPRIYSEQALARMFGVVVRSHLPSRDVFSTEPDRPRFAWGSGEDKTRHVLAYRRSAPERSDELLLNTELDSPATIDSTYYVGALGSGSAWRTMIKLVDKQNRTSGTKLTLPEDERRVRIEVTLAEHELGQIGIASLEDLRKFRFQTFQGKYFSFFLPSFASSQATGVGKLAGTLLQDRRRERFLNAGVLGLQAMDQAWRRRSKKARRETLGSSSPLPALRRAGTGSTSTVLRYEALTDQVVQALRHLGRRVQASPSSRPKVS